MTMRRRAGGADPEPMTGDGVRAGGKATVK